ncbi:MAG: hypothetical protein KF796_14100 [Ramlibacter sp.]|nr:hypothetical protein [Ramlibacter sp.]
MSQQPNQEELHFTQVKGVVCGLDQSSETVYGKRYSVLARDTVATSELREECRFWLRDALGQEHQVVFDAQLPIRDGHEIVLTSAGMNGAKIPVAIYNVTTRQLIRKSADHITKQFPALVAGQYSGCAGFFLALSAVVLPIFSIGAFPSHRSEAALISFAVPTALIVAGEVRGARGRRRSRDHVENRLVAALFSSTVLGASIPSDATVLIA